MKSLYPNLDREMAESKIEYPALAVAIGMHPMAVYRRLVGKSEWKLHEAMKICGFFDNYDMKTLFLRLDNKS